MTTHGDYRGSHQGDAESEFVDGSRAAVSGIKPELLADLGHPARETVLASFNGPTAAEDGEHLIRRRDLFRDLYLVQSGSFKAYTDDITGREHVMGFFLPGDVLGLDAIYTGRYRANFSALEPSSICSIRYSVLNDLCGRFPELNSAIFQMMSRHLARSETLAGSYRSHELLAGFIMMMSRRYGRFGRPQNKILLSMSRRDLANYLRLAPETVSRLFTRFSRDGLIQVKSRIVLLMEPERLSWLAGPLREL